MKDPRKDELAAACAFGMLLGFLITAVSFLLTAWGVQ